MNGQTTTFTMDLNSGLTQALSDGTHDYIYGIGRIAQVNGSAPSFFLTDALGSVRQLTDSTGSLTFAQAYAPYGTVAATSGSGSSYGFTGEYQNQELVYLRARHYAPDLGRFLTRDTWEGVANRPMSYNRWGYGYGNPVKYTDPTGHVSQLTSFKPGDEYGRIEIAEWSSDEKRLIEQAAWNIAVAYARSYNSYVMSNIPTVKCLVKANGMPLEVAYILLNSGGMGIQRIDPTSAFLRIHGGKVTFSKHDHKYKQTYTDKNGKKVTEEKDNYGLGPNSNNVYIYPNGEYTVFRYGKGNSGLSEANYIRFITHEMGHVFDHAINDVGRAKVTGDLASGKIDQKSGFCGKYSTNGAYGEGWQWRSENKSWEYFADMFTGWVYDCWEPLDPLYPKRLSDMGQLRSNFMNENMPKWIYEKINGSAK